MYEYIKGPVTSLTPTAAVIEAGGVGYLLNISLQSYAALASMQEAKVWVHHIVRDDAQLFYGFSTTGERDLFRLLITVSGIGANTARIILSSYSPDELATIIATGNTASLNGIKGIGTKTAERIILDLKGKVLGSGSSESAASAGSLMKDSPMEEAISALMVLGFTRAATEKVVRGIFGGNPAISSEDLIRESLTRL